MRLAALVALALAAFALIRHTKQSLDPSNYVTRLNAGTKLGIVRRPPAIRYHDRALAYGKSCRRR